MLTSGVCDTFYNSQHLERLLIKTCTTMYVKFPDYGICLIGLVKINEKIVRKTQKMLWAPPIFPIQLFIFRKVGYFLWRALENSWSLPGRTTDG